MVQPAMSPEEVYMLIKEEFSYYYFFFFCIIILKQVVLISNRCSTTLVQYLVFVQKNKANKNSVT